MAKACTTTRLSSGNGLENFFAGSFAQLIEPIALLKNSQKGFAPDNHNGYRVGSEGEKRFFFGNEDKTLMRVIFSARVERHRPLFDFSGFFRDCRTNRRGGIASGVGGSAIKPWHPVSM